MKNKKHELKQKARNIKVIATDVDGVLTDGSLVIDESGMEPFGKFSILDGMGVTIAHDCGLKIVVISRRKSLCTENRCNKLGISEVYTGVMDKADKFREVARRLNLQLSQLAYIGDDIIDLPAISLAGLKVAPKNGVKSVKQYVDYITKARGGNGVLREVVELVLKAQGSYSEYMQQYLQL